jgi:hypothetical protein
MERERESARERERASERERERAIASERAREGGGGREVLRRLEEVRAKLLGARFVSS